MKSVHHRRVAALAVAVVACVACQDGRSEPVASTSSATSLQSAGGAVVTHGAFTHMYVFQRNFPGETWDQHIAGLRPKLNDAASFSRASIDAVSDFTMDGSWPSYWDPA
jgi:hypothetical protein